MHSDLLPKSTDSKGGGKKATTAWENLTKLLYPSQHQQWSHIDSMRPSHDVWE